MRVTTWGRRGLGVIVIRVGEHGIQESLRRSVERRTGLAVVSVREDGTSLDRQGRPESHHYQLTLGTRCRTGGYSVAGELWAAVPCA